MLICSEECVYVFTSVKGMKIMWVLQPKKPCYFALPSTKESLDCFDTLTCKIEIVWVEIFFVESLLSTHIKHIITLCAENGEGLNWRVYFHNKFFSSFFFSVILRQDANPNGDMIRMKVDLLSKRRGLGRGHLDWNTFFHAHARIIKCI